MTIQDMVGAGIMNMGKYRVLADYGVDAGAWATDGVKLVRLSTNPQRAYFYDEEHLDEIFDKVLES